MHVRRFAYDFIYQIYRFISFSNFVAVLLLLLLLFFIRCDIHWLHRCARILWLIIQSAEYAYTHTHTSLASYENDFEVGYWDLFTYKSIRGYARCATLCCAVVFEIVLFFFFSYFRCSVFFYTASKLCICCLLDFFSHSSNSTNRIIK